MLYVTTRAARRRSERRQGRQLLAGDDHANVIRIQGFTIKQSLRHAVHRVLMIAEDGIGRLVGLVHQAAHFRIDLTGCFLGEVAVLRNLTTEEDLLFLLAKGQGAHAAHPVLANHLARQVRCPFDVISGAGGLAVHEDLLGAAAAHQDGKLGFEVILGDGVLVFFGQLHGHA